MAEQSNVQRPKSSIPNLRWMIRLIGPALLLYFLTTIDLGELWSTLLRTDPWLFGLAIVLAGPFLILKAARWLLILKAWHMPLPLRQATVLYCIGIFLGIVTPGQAGDAVKAWYLRKLGYPLSASLASCVVDRLFDVGISAALAATGLYFFWDILPGGRALNVVVVVGLIVGVLGGLVIVGSRRLRAWVGQRIVPRIVPATLRQRLANDGLESLHLTPRQIMVITLVSIAGLAWTYIRIYLLFLALDTPFPIGPFIALVAIISIVGTASPGGVGTRDAAMILIISAVLQIDPEQSRVLALALSTLLLVLNIENLLIGFAFSLRYPLDAARQEVLAES